MKSWFLLTPFIGFRSLFLPGGDVNIYKPQFTRVAKVFYDLAIKVSKPEILINVQVFWMSDALTFTVFRTRQANDASDYFPIWGTCQGFQQLTALTSNKNLLTLTDTKAVTLPLTFSQGDLPLMSFGCFSVVVYLKGCVWDNCISIVTNVTTVY